MYSKQAAFFKLLGDTYDKLPKRTFANELIEKGVKTEATRLNLVRNGKIPNLPILVEAVQLLLPDYKIDEQILNTYNS